MRRPTLPRKHLRARAAATQAITLRLSWDQADALLDLAVEGQAYQEERGNDGDDPAAVAAGEEAVRKLASAVNAGPLVKVRSRTLRVARGGTPYYSEELECGHVLDECPGDPLDARMRKVALRRRCRECARGECR